MKLRSYLPSGQFVSITLSLLLSSGLVYGAERYVNPTSAISTVVSSVDDMPDTDWQSQLAIIEAQSGISLPDAPSEQQVQSLIEASKTGNLTDDVSRALLINITSAGSQGLGGDIPTQDKIISDAIAKVNQQKGAGAYTQADIKVVDQTSANLKAYGNAAMRALSSHPAANAHDVFVATAQASDKNDEAELQSLDHIAEAYADIAQDLKLVAVPKNMAPFHLQIINNFVKISETLDGMKTLISDPLRGLASFQLYQSLIDETNRLFTTIATQLQKNAIIFNKDEPGSAWSYFLSAPM